MKKIFYSMAIVSGFWLTSPNVFGAVSDLPSQEELELEHRQNEFEKLKKLRPKPELEVELNIEATLEGLLTLKLERKPKKIPENLAE